MVNVPCGTNAETPRLVGSAEQQPGRGSAGICQGRVPTRHEEAAVLGRRGEARFNMAGA